MANDEQVAMLKQGVATWNAWRDENPNILPHLSEASLSNSNLRGAVLDVANLTQADLSRANLSGACATDHTRDAGGARHVRLLP
jgi:uncharacterized protein YjbI with pentapeptide repeats